MLAKSVVGALERVVAGEPLGDAATPAVLTFLEILFADTAVQAVKPLPPPWALETSRGVKAALAEITGAGDAFNVAAVVSALVAPSHLTVDTPLRRALCDGALHRRLARDLGVEEVKEDARDVIDVEDDMGAFDDGDWDREASASGDWETDESGVLVEPEVEVFDAGQRVALGSLGPAAMRWALDHAADGGVVVESRDGRHKVCLESGATMEFEDGQLTCEGDLPPRLLSPVRLKDPSVVGAFLARAHDGVLGTVRGRAREGYAVEVDDAGFTWDLPPECLAKVAESRLEKSRRIYAAQKAARERADAAEAEAEAKRKAEVARVEAEAEALRAAALELEAAAEAEAAELRRKAMAKKIQGASARLRARSREKAEALAGAEAAAATAAPDLAAAAPTFRVGDRVEARYRGRAQHFPGSIAMAYSKWLYDVRYDDGVLEKRVTADLIRAPGAAAAAPPPAPGRGVEMTQSAPAYRPPAPAAYRPPLPPPPPRPPPPPAQAPQQMSVIVPPNAPPGTQLTIQGPDGRLYRVVVPPGAYPGFQMTVALAPPQDAPPPQWMQRTQQFQRQF